VVDSREPGPGEAPCQNPELGADTATDFQNVIARGEIDPVVNPRDEMLGLMDQPLLFLRVEGVDVTFAHQE
jgi:hypothetical protein